MEVKEKIEKIMSEKNMTVEDLAAAIGVSASSLRLVLKDKGIVSKYAVEKIDKYAADNGVAFD